MNFSNPVIEPGTNCASNWGNHENCRDRFKSAYPISLTSFGNMLMIDESRLLACSSVEMVKPSKRKIADILPIAPDVLRATLTFLRDFDDRTIATLLVYDISAQEILSIEVFRMFTRATHGRRSEQVDSVASLRLKRSYRRVEVRFGSLPFAARRILAWPR